MATNYWCGQELEKRITVSLPEEVAQIIVFLTSDKAPFITGSTIGIDGGKLA